ncbi:MAG: AAA family ATPase, partial [Deltaproteobacteria bacterium]|nr:AAA family ATPase [Deltaproteobacteria bacterium]
MEITRNNINYFKTLIDDPKMRSVLLLEGARQVGKSTFIDQVLRGRDNVISLNFERSPEIRHDIDQTKNFSEF